MRRILALCALLLSLTPAPAHAQVACAPGAVTQHDMVGVYAAPEHRMRVAMAPCGSTEVLWDNPWGRHSAIYVAIEPLAGGGYLAGGLAPDPVVGYLDGANTVGFKPDTEGHIQVITASPYGEIVGRYRLRKVE